MTIVRMGGDYFFLYLWAFVLAFSIFMMVFYPQFIAPLFDKYSPLPEGSELRNRIEELAASIEFPLYKLFVVEGSKRSSHSNAYFYGFFKFKRIVLFDTLLDEDLRKQLLDAEKKEERSENDKENDKKKDNTDEKEDDKKEERTTDNDKEEDEKKEERTTDDEKKEDEKKKVVGCNIEEILGVLGHELGHWKLNHVLKGIILAQIHILLMFALFGYLSKNQLLFSAFGFTQEKPALIGLMIIVQFIAAPYNALIDFLLACNSRRFEFQADTFAVRLNKAEALRSALIKLNNDNLSFPIYDWLYSTFHHSHPPLLERLLAIDEEQKKKK